MIRQILKEIESQLVERHYNICVFAYGTFGYDSWRSKDAQFSIDQKLVHVKFKNQCLIIERFGIIRTVDIADPDFIKLTVDAMISRL